jgi:hypothetical protein
MNKELLARIEELEARIKRLEQLEEESAAREENENECLGYIEGGAECGEGWDDEPTEDIDRNDEEEEYYE